MQYRNALNKAFNLFIFSSFYIAGCAVAMAFQTAYLYARPHAILFYGFVFCGTVTSYNLHWALTPKLFQNPISPKSSFDAIPQKLHILLAIIGAVGSGVFFVLLRQHWFWLAGAGFLSFLYTAPKIPLRITRVLQKIAYGKTIFLTLAWTYITAMLPLLITDAVFDASHIIFCVNRFFLIYAICILFDLRDRNSDQKAGIKSIITNAPISAVNRMYWGTLIVYFFTTVLLLFHFPIGVVIAFLIPGVLLSIGYGWFKKQQADYVYNFILDGLMIFSLPLLLLFRI